MKRSLKQKFEYTKNFVYWTIKDFKNVWHMYPNVMIWMWLLVGVAFLI